MRQSPMDLPNDILAHLRKLYSEPHRHHHNWQHIQSCLAEFSRVRGEAEHPDCVELAIYFHDAIYDPRSNGNEPASAALAHESLAGLLPRPRLARVQFLIMSTNHQHV